MDCKCQKWGLLFLLPSSYIHNPKTTCKKSMSLFQKSVLNKYLAEQDITLLEKQYSFFKSYFLNTTIQKNIIASKEEEFQEGFLRELFVKVLGYTINPEPDYNLRTELKNEKDSKKA